MDKESGNKSNMEINLGNIGRLYIKINRYKEAEEYLQNALSISKTIGDKDGSKKWEQNLSLVDSARGNFKLAYMHYKMYILYSDSLLNENNTKKQTRTELQYEFDKQQAADSVKIAEGKKVATAELKSEVNKRYSLYGGLFLVLVFAGFTFNRFRVTQKQKKIIESQKKLVEEQKQIVEMKQKEVLDSIHYAKRIQSAIITSEFYINKNLKRLND